MRERKYVKFRVDMYSDTKFKIIDRMEKRDLIHYVWNRVVMLAGKVNLAGELYLSRNIPYTIETLAIEFNRELEDIRMAMKVLIDLEMVELIEGKIYRVKNFAKHQNIKVKEEAKVEEGKVKGQGDLEEGELRNETTPEKQLDKDDNLDSKVTLEVQRDINTNKEQESSSQKIINSAKDNEKDSNPNNIIDISKEIKNNAQSDEVKVSIPIVPKRKNTNTLSQDIISIDEAYVTDVRDGIVEFIDGEETMPLGKGEKILMTFTM